MNRTAVPGGEVARGSKTEWTWVHYKWASLPRDCIGAAGKSWSTINIKQRDIWLKERVRIRVENY